MPEVRRQSAKSPRPRKARNPVPYLTPVALQAGYWVRAKKIYIEKYGLPQRRKRVVVVGNLEQCPFEVHLTEASFPDSQVANVSLA